MPSVIKNKIVNYTSKQMYDLVNDVRSYADFVPYCVSSEVMEQNLEEVHATLAFARAGMHKSFSTLNRLQPDKMIEIRLIDGPFKHLEGFWCFENVGMNKCRVSLDLEFEFSSQVLAFLFGPLFHQVAGLLVDSFCERAKTVYGNAVT